MSGLSDAVGKPGPVNVNAVLPVTPTVYVSCALGDKSNSSILS